MVWNVLPFLSPSLRLPNGVGTAARSHVFCAIVDVADLAMLVVVLEQRGDKEFIQGRTLRIFLGVLLALQLVRVVVRCLIVVKCALLVMQVHSTERQTDQGLPLIAAQKLREAGILLYGSALVKGCRFLSAVAYILRMAVLMLISRVANRWSNTDTTPKVQYVYCFVASLLFGFVFGVFQALSLTYSVSHWLQQSRRRTHLNDFQRRQGGGALAPSRNPQLGQGGLPSEALASPELLPYSYEQHTVPTSRSFSSSIPQPEGGLLCCAICLEELVDGAIVRKIRCGHVYHIECIDSWFGAHRTCPMRCHIDQVTGEPRPPENSQ